MAVKPGRSTDRIYSFFLYIGIVTIIFFVGSKLINYSLDAKFYQLFLLKWQTTLQSFTANSGVYPQFTGKSQKAYMEDLIKRLNQQSILIPQSNTQTAYLYEMNGVNPFSNRPQLFILCLPDRIIIYNLSETTFKRLDKFIDGKHDMLKGAFIGKREENEKSYIGQFLY